MFSAPVWRPILPTAGPGMRLQIWRKILKWLPLGLVVFFFIPALWQAKWSKHFFQFPVGRLWNYLAYLDLVDSVWGADTTKCAWPHIFAGMI
jgi:hypothetical protein